MGREWPRKREKILVPNSVHTRPELENSENNSKKNQKLRKLILALFLSKKG